MNYQVIIMMHSYVQSDMISITSRLLESIHVNKCELTINNGCKYFDWVKNLTIVLKREILAYVLVEPLLQS